MVNYAESLLLTAQAILTDKFSKPEMRHKDYSLTRTLLRNSNAMLPDWAVLKTSDQRVVEAYAFTKTASDATTQRIAAHAAAGNGDSQKVQLSWATKGQEFRTSIKAGGRNMFTQAQMLANRMEGAWIHLLDTIETTLAAYLAANKTQVNIASDGELGEWDSVNHVWKIRDDKKDWYYQYVAMMMAVNNYSSMLDVICDPVSFAIGQQIAAQGSANGTNTAFTLAGLDMLLSTSLAAEAGYRGYNYVIPRDTVGLLTWIPKENRDNLQTRLQTYTNMNDPFGLGINAALHMKESASDTNATGGEYQDEVIEYELTVDIATVKAPLSTTNETTIYKVALQEEGGA